MLRRMYDHKLKLSPNCYRDRSTRSDGRSPPTQSFTHPVISPFSRGRKRRPANDEWSLARDHALKCAMGRHDLHYAPEIVDVQLSYAVGMDGIR